MNLRILDGGSVLLERTMCHLRYNLGFPNDLEVMMYWNILAADVVYIRAWKPHLMRTEERTIVTNRLSEGVEGEH
jgi:hypothetical protein